jgi:hypothetical protein
MKKDITELFCLVDDFSSSMQKEITSQQLPNKNNRLPTRVCGIADSEIMTILILFQQSPCRNFKYFYKSYLQLYSNEFPRLPSYERFVALMPRVLHLLVLLLNCLLSGRRNGLFYVDSTSIAVCHPKRISSHKVCKELAALGKTTKGWFFGFKLHAIVDERGNLVRVKITSGNTDDRAVVDDMTKNINGLLFGDKGYISKELFLKLYKRGLKLVTGIKKTMKNILMPLREKILLRKRSLVETVFDYLKNKFMLEHTRHRSPFNMFIHIVSTLIAYQLKPTKPSISDDYALPNP